MKKVLVYMNENSLANVGGPLGYNYFLKQKLEELKINNIDYINLQIKKSNSIDSLSKKIKNKWYGAILKTFKDFVKRFSEIYKLKKTTSINLSKYDIVHFHSPLSMYLVKDSLKNYTGKVVLTSHSPTVSYKQYIDELTDFGKKHMHWFYRKMELFDIYAFNRADYIIFPCPEAEEPYFNNWDKYAEIKKRKENNYKYLITGTEARKAKCSREDICKKYNIPLNAFIISYAGRHNTIKGYDQLKEIGEVLLNTHDNVYFLIAGREDPMKGLKHERWIEVGWTNDPHSIISAADIFILPNRETYFDLVMLEVLSLGTIIIASYTGGNKYFEKNSSQGIFLYKSISESIIIIEKIIDMPNFKKNEIKQENINLFNKKFDLTLFAKNYSKLINSL